MSFYAHHVFFCTNQRDPGEGCCADMGAQGMRDYLKKRIKELGMDGPGKVRVNNAGCLGRCDDGPVVVVYPQGTWYTYVDQEDVEDILQEHLINGRIVDRLKI